MAKYDLVVAKYKEDVSWLKYFSDVNIYIYDKSPNPITNSIYRENLGREGETWAYHFFKNYDNLSEYTILCQGNPWEHMLIPQFEKIEVCFQYFLNFEIITKPKQSRALFAKIAEIEIDTLNNGLKMREYLRYFFGEIFFTEYPTKFRFAVGAQFIVYREFVSSIPKEVFYNICKMMKNGTTIFFLAHFTNINFSKKSVHAWTMERIYYCIFTGYPLSEEFISDSIAVYQEDLRQNIINQL